MSLSMFTGEEIQALSFWQKAGLFGLIFA